MHRFSRSAGLMAAASALALGFAGAARAQEGPEAQTTEVEAITVTGSRIPRKDYSSNSPISTVGAEEFQVTSSATPETLLNTLPQVAPDTSPSSTDKAGFGRANVNLRSLGANRNVVLVNGRRMVGSDAAGNVDLNVIPVALIDRVELITGGASAVYGADAVAGVVNFIMKDRFEGFQLSTQYGMAEQGDATEFNLNLTAGGSFADGRGRMVFSYDYFDRSHITMADRAFSRESEYATNTLPWGAYNPGSNLPTQAGVDAAFAAYGLPAGSALRTDFLGFNNDGTLFSLSVSPAAPPPANFRGDLNDPLIAKHFYPERLAYQYSQQTSLVMPLTRNSFYGSVRYDLTPDIEAYGQFLFTKYVSQLWFGSSSGASTFNGGNHVVPVTNPFIPQALRNILATRPNPNGTFLVSTRMIQFGPRIESYDNEVYQVTAGLKGKLPNGWTWDVYAASGELHNTTHRANGGSWAAFQRLLNAPDGGASLCAGGLNLFGREKISQACVDYVNSSSTVLTDRSSLITEASLAGDLFELPAGPVGFAVGAQYRQEDYDYQPDMATRTGDIAGYPMQPRTFGEFDNTDVYAEVRVPIVRDLPLIQLASVTGGFRHSEHSVVGGFNSYKIDGEWQVVDPLRLRGSYQKAVRAPTLGELFTPPSYTLPTVTDPCNVNSSFRTGANAAQVRSLCLAQGVPTGSIDTYIQPVTTVQAQAGGNPNLQEETAKTYTYGVVVRSPFENPWLSNVQLSVDYYNIKIENAISALQAATFIPRCFNSRGDNPGYSAANVYCGLFNRDANGAIQNALQTAVNIATINVAGVDAQLNWRAPTPDGFGTLDVDLSVGWLQKYERRDAPGDTVFNYAGTIGPSIGDSLPEWKMTMTTTWRRDDLSLGTRLRYIDAMSNRSNVTTPNSGSNVPGTYYLDLFGGFEFGNVAFRAGVNNILDQQPRLYTPQQQAKTDPSTYDVVGRRYWVGLTAKF